MEAKSLIHPFGKYLCSTSHVPGTTEALGSRGKQARISSSNPSTVGQRRVGALNPEAGMPALGASPPSPVVNADPEPQISFFQRSQNACFWLRVNSSIIFKYWPQNASDQNAAGYMRPVRGPQGCLLVSSGKVRGRCLALRAISPAGAFA